VAMLVAGALVAAAGTYAGNCNGVACPGADMTQGGGGYGQNSPSTVVPVAS
jgi:hypothetical protein